MSLTQLGLGFGTVCMGGSTIAFQMMAQEETKRFNYVAMAVTGIATMAYLAMFCGAGITEIDGRDVYWMRYVDWFFTTPFFLLDLALLAAADNYDTFYVMLMNAICIASGAIGALNPDAKMPMFILGMVTFVMFIVKLFGAMMTKAQSLGADVGAKYTSVTATTMAIWCIYPAMYLAAEVYHVVTVEQEVLIYAIIDVVAKCGMGFLLLGSHDVLKAVVNSKKTEPLLA
jgi:bacteriorhodopsin